MLVLSSIKDRARGSENRNQELVGSAGTTIRTVVRALQFILALVTAGIYGTDLSRASRLHKRADASIIYAEVVAALSILTCALHCAVSLRRILWAPWDFIMCVLWAALFGVFGTTYLDSSSDEKIGSETASTGSRARMKAAVWVDMIGMLLWAFTFVQAMIWCCGRSRTRKGNEKYDILSDRQEIGTEVPDSVMREACDKIMTGCGEKRGTEKSRGKKGQLV